MTYFNSTEYYKVRSDDTETLSSDREHNKNRKLLCESTHHKAALKNFSFFVKNHELAQNLDLDFDLEQAVIMPRNQYGRADINFRSFFQDFNMSKFVVYTSLLIFSMLFALRKDGVINWSWWSIFIPLFVWKGIAGMYIIFVKKCLYVLYYT